MTLSVCPLARPSSVNFAPLLNIWKHNWSTVTVPVLQRQYFSDIFVYLWSSLRCTFCSVWQLFGLFSFCASAMFGATDLTEWEIWQCGCFKWHDVTQRYNKATDRQTDRQTRNVVSYLSALFPQQKKLFCVNKIRNGRLSIAVQTSLRRSLLLKCRTFAQNNVSVILFSPQEQCVLFSTDFRKIHNCSTALSGDLVCRILQRSDNKRENQLICVPN